MCTYPNTLPHPPRPCPTGRDDPAPVDEAAFTQHLTESLENLEAQCGATSPREPTSPSLPTLALLELTRTLGDLRLSEHSQVAGTPLSSADSAVAESDSNCLGLGEHENRERTDSAALDASNTKLRVLATDASSRRERAPPLQLVITDTEGTVLVKIEFGGRSFQSVVVTLESGGGLTVKVTRPGRGSTQWRAEADTRGVGDSEGRTTAGPDEAGGASCYTTGTIAPVMLPPPVPPPVAPVMLPPTNLPKMIPPPAVPTEQEGATTMAHTEPSTVHEKEDEVQEDFEDTSSPQIVRSGS
ncbi:hypothetical protein FOMPIDRAFT_93892 [Fomitopsis schrenkii]|uniref:Uncharacterized protein n=1 Tax=Fomitopsis schrenkii TaxID=2126942 RepID=S8DRW1_FOMSC|nr:hypothetical protein FOMPIDRAFT_93892 [Fomitopsis schrenkii]